MVKLRGPAVGVGHTTVDLANPEPVMIDFDADCFVALRGQVEGTEPLPDALSLFIDPKALEGVPAALIPFLRQARQGVFDAYFAKVDVWLPTFTLRLKRGEYRVGGACLNYDRPMTINPQYCNYQVRAISVGPGEALPGDESNGFVLTVDHDRDIRLQLRVVVDAELLGQ